METHSPRLVNCLRSHCEDLEVSMIIAIIFIVGWIIGFVVGFCVATNEYEKTAVKAGKAEYYLDENNNKQWRWK